MWLQPTDAYGRRANLGLRVYKGLGFVVSQAVYDLFMKVCKALMGLCFTRNFTGCLGSLATETYVNVFLKEVWEVFFAHCQGSGPGLRTLGSGFTASNPKPQTQNP